MLVVAFSSSVAALTTMLVASSSSCTKYDVLDDENAGSKVPGDTCKLFKLQLAERPSSSVVFSSSLSSLLSFSVVGLSVVVSVATVTFAPACVIASCS